MTEPLLWGLKPRAAGVFSFTLDGLTIRAHHKPVTSVVTAAARSKAGEICHAIEDGAGALADIGMDPGALDHPIMKAGLQDFVYAAEVWVAAVERVEFEQDGENQSGEMPSGEVYKALLEPALFRAWEGYITRTIGSLSEGNVFAP